MRYYYSKTTYGWSSPGTSYPGFIPSLTCSFEVFLKQEVVEKGTKRTIHISCAEQFRHPVTVITLYQYVIHDVNVSWLT